MKNGKKPTLAQKQQISKRGLKSSNWLVCKSLNDQLHIVHRETGTKRVITV